MKELQRPSITPRNIYATLEKCRTADRAEYKLAWRDLMNRGRYSDARELTGKYFQRGILTAQEALADIEAVKIALELNEQKLRN